MQGVHSGSSLVFYVIACILPPEPFFAVVWIMARHCTTDVVPGFAVKVLFKTAHCFLLIRKASRRVCSIKILVTDGLGDPSPV